jgi:(p)ppGpp synthase/HD superfamily hydrolase
MNESERKIFSDDFERALVFANRLHASQTRKGTDIPYISHLMAVASLVLEHGGDRDQAIAALLHDSIEDQGGEYPGSVGALRKKISSEFGERVLEIVEACTDADTVPKPPWRDRKEQYLRHLESVPSYVLLVSCADKLHNARAIVSDLRSLGDHVFSRFTAGKEGTLWYYRSLADTFKRVGPKALAVELDLAVREMERLAESLERP